MITAAARPGGGEATSAGAVHCRPRREDLEPLRRPGRAPAPAAVPGRRRLPQRLGPGADGPSPRRRRRPRRPGQDLERGDRRARAGIVDRAAPGQDVECGDRRALDQVDTGDAPVREQLAAARPGRCTAMPTCARCATSTRSTPATRPRRPGASISPLYAPATAANCRARGPSPRWSPRPPLGPPPAAIAPPVGAAAAAAMRASTRQPEQLADARAGHRDACVSVSRELDQVDAGPPGRAAACPAHAAIAELDAHLRADPAARFAVTRSGLETIVCRAAPRWRRGAAARAPSRALEVATYQVTREQCSG